MDVGIKISRDFLPISRYISQTIQDIAIVTMEGGRYSPLSQRAAIAM